MEKLEVDGGEGELVFRLRHTKEQLKLQLLGPREIIGLPGEWIDGVIELDSDTEIFPLVLSYLEKKKSIDRLIVKVKNEKLRRELKERGFQGIGPGIYLKAINPELARLLP